MDGPESMTRAIEVIRHVARRAQPPVEPVAPGVVWADEHAAAGVPEFLGADARAPVATDIQQRAHLAVLAAHDEERLTAETGGEKITGLTHLAVVTHAVPVAQHQPSHLALEQLRIAVEIAAERVTFALRGDRLRAAVRARRGDRLGGRARRLRHRGHQCPEPTCQLALMPKVRGR